MRQFSDGARDERQRNQRRVGEQEKKTAHVVDPLAENKSANRHEHKDGNECAIEAETKRRLVGIQAALSPTA